MSRIAVLCGWPQYMVYWVQAADWLLFPERLNQTKPEADGETPGHLAGGLRRTALQIPSVMEAG